MNKSQIRMMITSVDENSQMGNGVCETEGVSDGALAEPIKNRDDNKSVETGETAETGNNSVAEKDSDVVKQVIMYDCTSGQHITNSDGDGSADEMAEMADGVCEKEVEVEGDLVKQAEQTKNNDDDNVMIGENIDESKANPDATQRPNINSDLAVQEREIVGMSDLVEDKNNAIESSVIGIEKVEDDGDNIPTTGNRDRSSLQTVEEVEERKDNPLHSDDDGDNIPTAGNCDRSSLQTFEEVEERKDNPLCSDDDGDNIPTTGNRDRSSLQTAEEVEEQKDHPLRSDNDGDRSPLQTVEEVAARTDDPLHNDDAGHSRHEKTFPKSMETEMKEREILFSDSDVKNKMDEDKELTDIIDTLTEEIIETLAEETVSKYYPLETEETQCPNPRLDSAHKLNRVLSADVESGDEEDNYSLAKLRALNQLKETLREGTPMSMEEYRLRNEEELDTKTIHKKCVKAVTASSISDKGASASSISDKGASAPSDSDQEQSTGVKSDTTFSNGIESDSSEEWMVITRKKNKGKKSKK